MAELGLTHSHLTTILNALASVDRRLCRIEAALKIPNFNNNANSAVSGGPSSSSHGSNPATAAQAGHLATAPPPQPSQAALHHQHHPQPPVILSSHSSNHSNHSNTTNSLLTPTAINTNFTPLEPPPQGYTISSRATMVSSCLNPLLPCFGRFSVLPGTATLHPAFLPIRPPNALRNEND